MAVADIVSYIRANEGLYPREALVMRLHEAGYPDSEIHEAFTALSAAAFPNPAPASRGVLYLLGLAIMYLVLIVFGVVVVVGIIIANIF